MRLSGKTTFTPIRTCIGNALPFDLRLVRASSAADKSGLVRNLRIKSRTDELELSTDQDLLTFWPEIVQSPGGITGSVPQTYQADPAQPLLIAQDSVGQRFGPDVPFKSIYAQASRNSIDSGSSRSFSLTFRITLEARHLIGGIALGGYPALGHYIDKFGRTSSNFGLPREARISIGSERLQQQGFESPFIDADLHATQQLVNHSSGVHFFQVEPTHTDLLTLELSDFPLLLDRVEFGSRGYRYTHKHGIVIPYLYVFSYQERTHYQPHVPGGVLGVVKQKRSEIEQKTNTSFTDQGWIRFLNADGTRNYQFFPASSIFRKNRAYFRTGGDAGFPSGNDGQFTLEQFVSQPLKTEERLSIVCQQCSDNLRSLAGIELLIPVAASQRTSALEDKLEKQIGLPFKEVNLLDKVGIRIYELDFPSGVSPLDVHKEGIQKYKYLLADRQITDDQALSYEDKDLDARPPNSPPNRRSIRFRRPSNQRYFEIEITNLGATDGQAVILGATFLQSAHITLHPKQSRQLSVGQLHFRIIGHQLADDYATIGAERFGFAIELLSGGQALHRIASITSLLDLIQMGSARFLSNARQRAVEFEKSNVYHPHFRHPGEEKERSYAGMEIPYQGAFPEEQNDNFQITQSFDRSKYWHKVQTGKQTIPDEQPVSENEVNQGQVFAKIKEDHDLGFHQQYLNFLLGDDDPNNRTFESYATSESATHSELSFPDAGWNGVKNYFDSVEDFALFLIDNKIVPNNPRVFRELIDEKYWNGLEPSDLAIRGLTNFFLNPGSLFTNSGINEPVPTNNNEPNALLNLFIRLLRGQISPGTFIEEYLEIVGSAPDTRDPSPTPHPMTLLYFGGSGGGVGASGGFSVGIPPLVNLSVGVSPSIGMQSPFPGAQHSGTLGNQGTLNKQSNRTGYSYSKTLNEQGRIAMNAGSTVAGEHKRIVERKEVPDTDQNRIKGAEIMWQGKLADIIVGSIPLDINFPALADRSVGHRDEVLRIRFSNGIGVDLEVDFWFDINEIELRDDF